MVGLGVVDGDDVHVALEETSPLARLVRAIAPGVIADGDALGQLELLDLLQDLRVSQADLLNLDQFVNVSGPLNIGTELLKRQDAPLRHIDKTLKEGLGIETVEENVGNAVGAWWEGAAQALGLDEGDDIGLPWLQDIKALEAQRDTLERRV